MSSERKTIRVAIIGGGIAGLTAAFRIREELRVSEIPYELVLFEQKKVCGGATRTLQDSGFSLEHGPNGWLSSEPLTAQIIDELGLTDQLVAADESASSRYVFTRNRLQPIPMTPFKFLTSGLLRPWEKMRVLKEYFTRAKFDESDETIFDFGCRRFGKGFTETMLDPMVSGVFAGNIHELSLPATFPKMRMMEQEYGGMFRAMFAKKRAKKKEGQANEGGPSGPAGVLTTLKEGTGQLTSTLASKLEPNIRKDCAVTKLMRDENQFVISSDRGQERFDAVVMAAPAYAAAEIINELSPETAQALRDISFANVAVVSHVYDGRSLPVALNGFGHLIPRREGIRALGCLWTSCIFPDQSPDGKVLLRTILGGAHDPEILNLSDSELMEVVQESTATCLKIKTAPEKSWIFRHQQGIAQYMLGHRERVKTMEQFCKTLPGIAFVGSSYRGVALNRCIRDAYTIAPKVLVPFGWNAPSLEDS